MVKLGLLLVRVDVVEPYCLSKEVSTSPLQRSADRRVRQDVVCTHIDTESPRRVAASQKPIEPHHGRGCRNTGFRPVRTDSLQTCEIPSNGEVVSSIDSEMHASKSVQNGIYTSHLDDRLR